MDEWGKSIGELILAAGGLAAWLNAHITRKKVSSPEERGHRDERIENIEGTLKSLRRETSSLLENLAEHVVEHDKKVITLIEQALDRLPKESLRPKETARRKATQRKATTARKRG